LHDELVAQRPPSSKDFLPCLQQARHSWLRFDVLAIQFPRHRCGPLAPMGRGAAHRRPMDTISLLRVDYTAHLPVSRIRRHALFV
jgi:hypothetical protein